MQATERSAPTDTVSRFHWPAAGTFFSRRWWWTTVLVLLGMAVLVRLGFWQLDRREQRRAHNAEIRQQLSLPPLFLEGRSLPAEPEALKNRLATVRGAYDLERQVAWTQQNWASAPGFHLITPLVLAGGESAVLVDRGWLPAAQLSPENWAQYDVSDPLTVTGYIKLSQTRPQSAKSVDRAEEKETRQTEWYRVDIEALDAQLPYDLLSVYLQQAPPPEGNDSLPFREALDLNLSEGNHFSYAIQWFIFATIFGVGYVYYVGKRIDDDGDER